MSTTLYDLTVPVFLRSFAALSAFLEKGRAYAEANGLNPEELLQARLYPDMAPLTAQIQRASDTAKGAVVRLGGAEPVAMADDEATFNDLQARIAKTVKLLESASREAMEGKEEADVMLQAGQTQIAFKGRDYVLSFVLPNFFFHVTTAYDLLRHKGVPLAKPDYLGPIGHRA